MISLLNLVFWVILKQTNEPIYTLALVMTLPVLGKLLPIDNQNTLYASQLNNSPLQILPLLLHMVTSWIFMAALFIDYPIENYTTNQQIILTIALIFTVTYSFTTTHEMMHKNNRVLQYMAMLNLTMFNFTVYPIEHIFLHHKMVGTREDPITCPKNRNVYHFIFNAFVEAHKFACRYDFKRFAMGITANLVYIGALLFFALQQYQDWSLALWKVGYFVMLGSLCYITFELGEYVEHYGLIYRDKDG